MQMINYNNPVQTSFIGPEILSNAAIKQMSSSHIKTSSI